LWDEWVLDDVIRMRREFFAAISAFAFVFSLVFSLVAVAFVEWDFFLSYIRARIGDKHPREWEEHTIPVPAPHEKFT
jgi:hypothetical protein